MVMFGRTFTAATPYITCCNEAKTSFDGRSLAKKKKKKKKHERNENRRLGLFHCLHVQYRHVEKLPVSHNIDYSGILLPYEIGLQSAEWFQRRRCLKMWMNNRISLTLNKSLNNKDAVCRIPLASDPVFKYHEVIPF